MKLYLSALLIFIRVLLLQAQRWHRFSVTLVCLSNLLLLNLLSPLQHLSAAGIQGGTVGGDVVDAPGFGHQHHLQMPLQTERFSGRWEDLGKMKQSSQVLELPPASCRGGINGVQGQPLHGMGSHARGVPSRSLICSGCDEGLRGGR